jgi:hypothetical protein
MSSRICAIQFAPVFCAPPSWSRDFGAFVNLISAFPAFFLATRFFMVRIGVNVAKFRTM